MIDAHSETWTGIKGWAEKQRDSARLQLEAPGIDADAGNVLRGEIKTLNNLLKLTDVKPDIPETGADY